jgi:hypothetical protein
LIENRVLLSFATRMVATNDKQPRGELISGLTLGVTPAKVVTKYQDRLPHAATLSDPKTDSSGVEWLVAATYPQYYLGFEGN